MVDYAWSQLKAETDDIIQLEWKQLHDFLIQNGFKSEGKFHIVNNYIKSVKKVMASEDKAEVKRC